MIQRDGEVITKVVPNVRKKTLLPIIEANVAKGSTAKTEELTAYNGLVAKGYKHERVNHGKGEFARGETHVDSVENYWSQLKRSISGTHSCVPQAS